MYGDMYHHGDLGIYAKLKSTTEFLIPSTNQNLTVMLKQVS